MIEGKYDNDLVVLHEGAIVTQRLDPGLIRMRTLSKRNDCMLMMQSWANFFIQDLCKITKIWLIPQALFGQYNRHQDILKDISPISFPYLRKLFIRGNTIESIEIINSLDMPLLQNLWLSGNRISSLKSLRKANLPNITRLSIFQNYIQQINILPLLNYPKLRQLDVERSEDLNNSFGFAIIAKIQSNNNNFKIWALKNKRLKQKNITECLNKKFINLQVYVPNN